MSDSYPYAKLGFVRHGETSANIDKVWHGHTDTALTERGLLQARQLGEFFPNYMVPDVIYTSPLQRARITAESIAGKFNLDVIPDPRLMEFSLGDWEGVAFDQLTGDSGVFSQLETNPDFSAPGGESQRMVQTRMVEAIEEITERHSGNRVVIVAHGVSIAIALAHYLEGDTTRWLKYSKHNTSFSELCLNSRKLLSFNRTDHLADT